MGRRLIVFCLFFYPEKLRSPNATDRCENDVKCYVRYEIVIIYNCNASSNAIPLGLNDSDTAINNSSAVSVAPTSALPTPPLSESSKVTPFFLHLHLPNDEHRSQRTV